MMRRKNGIGVLGVLLILGVIAVIAVVLVPNFMRSRSWGHLTACKSNLKNIGTALDVYATDWSGHYPPSTAQLTPDYLKTIPTCAGAGKDSYSPMYTLGPETFVVVTCPLHDLPVTEGKESEPKPCRELKNGLEISLKKTGTIQKDLNHLPPELTHCPEGPLFEHRMSQLEIYTVCCGGENHPPNAPKNFPQYNPMVGLIESKP